MQNIHMEHDFFFQQALLRVLQLHISTVFLVVIKRSSLFQEMLPYEKFFYKISKAEFYWDEEHELVQAAILQRYTSFNVHFKNLIVLMVLSKICKPVQCLTKQCIYFSSQSQRFTKLCQQIEKQKKHKAQFFNLMLSDPLCMEMPLTALRVYPPNANHYSKTILSSSGNKNFFYN